MGKTEWLLLLFVVGALVGPFVAVKAIAKLRMPKKLPPPQPYKDEED